ncbi:hypothetical protein HUJ05_008207 [Dendroctonus ponderosae]|nr:hypothetical protein HUJ05_008207 [Dendroctonus ponderosae]
MLSKIWRRAVPIQSFGRAHHECSGGTRLDAERLFQTPVADFSRPKLVGKTRPSPGRQKHANPALFITVLPSQNGSFAVNILSAFHTQFKGGNAPIFLLSSGDSGGHLIIQTSSEQAAAAPQRVLNADSLLKETNSTLEVASDNEAGCSSSSRTAPIGSDDMLQLYAGICYKTVIKYLSLDERKAKFGQTFLNLSKVCSGLSQLVISYCDPSDAKSSQNYNPFREMFLVLGLHLKDDSNEKFACKKPQQKFLCLQSKLPTGGQEESVSLLKNS